MRMIVSLVAASIAFGVSACGSSNKQTEPQTAETQAAMTIPAGIEFTARLDDSITSTLSTPGQFVTLTTTSPLQDVAGNVAAPAGSKVRGRIVSVDRGVSPSIRLSLAGIDTKTHGTLPLGATIRNPGTPDEAYSSEEVYSPVLPYNVVLLPPSRRAGSGASVGGGPGAQPQPIILAAGTPLRLVLTKPLSVPSTQAAPAASGGG